jgi:acyl-CoA reductase-like NAD-dependent aldehyde dehydrogenase
MTPQGVNIRHPDKLFINGEWVAATSGRELEIVDPNTEEVVARTAEASNADIDRAVAAARYAFDHGRWPTTSPAERAERLMAMIDHLEPRVPELAAAWTAQIGGLASFAPVMHGGAIAGLRGLAALGHSFPWVEQKKGMVVDTAVIAREPVGVVAAIAPWNAPFGIMANKVFYALIAGCTVVVKPSPETPLEAYIIAEAAEAAGLPPGVLNLVPAEREASALHRIERGGDEDCRSVRAADRSLFARIGRQVGGHRAGRFPDRSRRGHSRQHHHRAQRSGLRHAQPRHRPTPPP